MHPITRQRFLAGSMAAGGLWVCASEAKTSGTVGLSSIARLYSMGMSATGDRIVLRNGVNSIEVETDSRRAWINGTMLWLHYPSRKSIFGWSISEVDFNKGIDPVMRSYAYMPSKAPKVLVLDPGHGGKDTGVSSARKVYEKLAVMDIARRVQEHLKGTIVVKSTRTSDIYLSLQERCDFAAKAGADLFVSIHADGAEERDASGVETFIPTAARCESTNSYGSGKGDLSSADGNLYDAANAVLGFSIQSNLVKNSKRVDRGLRRARFHVIRNAPCPAALVECGFLSNPAEEALMIEADYRESVARGISNGIRGYLTISERARTPKTSRRRK